MKILNHKFIPTKLSESSEEHSAHRISFSELKFIELTQEDKYLYGLK